MSTAAHKHYPECVCVHCEKHQTGFFAQRNFLAGDDDAGEHLGTSVLEFLKDERDREKDSHA
jgi:hypothetical protein